MKKAAAKTDYLISLILNTIKMVHEQTIGANKLDPFTFMRLKTLRFVSENPESSMKDIARYFHITPPSATSIINALVKMRYVKRIYDASDRRMIRLQITAEGRKNLKDGFKEVGRRIKKTLSALNSKEKKEFTKIMEKISAPRDGK
jgi:MarR family transcriptional regulator, organic hydroperoxide resistance regulator